jgi:hypothetical protein
MDSNNFSFEILWVGDKAMEVYQRTNSKIIEQFSHSFLLFNDKKRHTGVTPKYIEHYSIDQPITYDATSLKESVSNILSSSDFSNFHLLIGSSFELLCQAVVKEKCTGDSHKIVSETELFSEALFKHSDDTCVQSNPTVLFLHQDIPFKDLKQESELIKTFAMENAVASYTTVSSDTDISEFLFRLTDHSVSSISEMQIKKLS